MKYSLSGINQELHELSHTNVLSIPRNTEEIADDVEVFEVVLLIEVSIVFGLPEATGAHM